MKSLKELKEMLFDEFDKHLFKADLSKNLGYYNEVCGDASFIIAAILDKKLEERGEYWNTETDWVDDCLLTRINLEEQKLSIWGIMIWGKSNTTKQWTDSFYFELDWINGSSFRDGQMKFLFGDKNEESLIYSDFANDRGFWDRDFYKDDTWNIEEREWKHSISEI